MAIAPRLRRGWVQLLLVLGERTADGTDIGDKYAILAMGLYCMFRQNRAVGLELTTSRVVVSELPGLYISINKRTGCHIGNSRIAHSRSQGAGRV